MRFRYQQYGFTSEDEFSETIKQFHNQGLHQRQIAEQIGCSRLTIIKAFRIFKIKPKKGMLHEKLKFKTEKDMIKRFEDLYNEGFSQKDIAITFKSSPLSINKYLKKSKAESRSTSESIGILQKDVQLSDDELNIIHGILIGNGRLKRKAYTASLDYSCIHDEAINALLGKLSRLSPSFRFRRSINRGWYQIHTLSYMCLAQLYDEWYKDDKKLPTDIELTPESFYWWYIGDGNSTPEAIKIVTGISNLDILIKKMPVMAAWYKAHNKFYTISLQNIEDRIKFLKYIGPCKHQSYSYKWRVYNSRGKIVADLS